MTEAQEKLFLSIVRGYKPEPYGFRFGDKLLTPVGALRLVAIGALFWTPLLFLLVRVG